MEEWQRRQKEDPLKNRDIVRSRMHSGFHVGTLAYKEGELLAWISVSPLPEYYWTWRRTLRVGEQAPKVAGIACINIVPRWRGQGYQIHLLKQLKSYAGRKGWTMLEGYPFDEAAHKRHGDQVAWPGYPEAFLKAGFEKTEPHWLSSEEYPRSIYRFRVSETFA